MTSSSGSRRTPKRLKYLRGDLAAEVRDAVRFAIAVVARIASGFGEFFDDEFFGRIRRVAHAQVDYVVAGAAFLLEQAVDAAKQVRRQARDALGDLDWEGPVGWRIGFGHRFVNREVHRRRRRLTQSVRALRHLLQNSCDDSV